MERASSHRGDPGHLPGDAATLPPGSVYDDSDFEVAGFFKRAADPSQHMHVQAKRNRADAWTAQETPNWSPAEDPAPLAVPAGDARGVVPDLAQGYEFADWQDATDICDDVSQFHLESEGALKRPVDSPRCMQAQSKRGRANTFAADFAEACSMSSSSLHRCAAGPPSGLAATSMSKEPRIEAGAVLSHPAELRGHGADADPKVRTPSESAS